MKGIKVLFFSVMCSWSLSCSDSNAVYYDVPALLHMTKIGIVNKLGKPNYSRKMKEFNTMTPFGHITIPSETTMDTYVSHGYALRIYYFEDRCDYPINFFLYKEHDHSALDSVAIVQLKRVYNLKDTTHLPKSVFQKASDEGYSILNLDCL
jgi:hypothetical protein